MQCLVHSIKAEIIGERSLQYIDYAGEFNIYQNLTFICVSNIFPSEPRLRIWRSWSHRTRPQAQVEHPLPHQYITQEWIGCPNTKQGGTWVSWKKYNISQSVSRAIWNSTLDKAGTSTPSTNDRTLFWPLWRAVRIGISCAAHGPGFLPPLFLCVLP